MPQLRGISTSLVLRRPIQSGVAVPTGLCRRTPKAVAFRGAPPNWRMSRQRLALWSAVAEPRSGADTAFAHDCAQKFATVRAKAASPSLRDSAAALQRLSLMAAPRQTGECLGSGLPFGVRWQSREAAPTPLSLATVRRSSPRFERKRRRRPYGTLPPHSKGYRSWRRLQRMPRVFGIDKHPAACRIVQGMNLFPLAKET